MVSFAFLLVVGGAIAITVTGGGAKSAARKGEGIDLEKPSSTQPSSSPSSDSTDAPLETEMTSKFDTKTSGEEETTTNTETVDIDITTESVLRRLFDEATSLNPGVRRISGTASMGTWTTFLSPRPRPSQLIKHSFSILLLTTSFNCVYYI